MLVAGLNITANVINKTSVDFGFPPIADKNAQIVILGSMPSVKSLEQQQYYAHPRNAFWSIMSALFDLEKELDYSQRCEQLITNNIAIWDVLKSCQRQGSLDKDIEKNSLIANDFNAFFQHHPNIQHILFNGGKAEHVFKQYVEPLLEASFQHIRQTRLPSTSPAHAAITFEQKRVYWEKALLSV